MEALTGLGGMRGRDWTSTSTGTPPTPASGYRYGSPDGLGRNAGTASVSVVNRHSADTRIGLMDSTVPIEAMVGGDC